MMKAIELDRYHTAANELLYNSQGEQSKYAKQVGRRATEMAEWLKEGSKL